MQYVLVDVFKHRVSVCISALNYSDFILDYQDENEYIEAKRWLRM